MRITDQEDVRVYSRSRTRVLSSQLAFCRYAIGYHRRTEDDSTVQIANLLNSVDRFRTDNFVTTIYILSIVRITSVDPTIEYSTVRNGIVEQLSVGML